MRLLEREAALASLGEYAAEASRGAGRLVLVSGEAGVGKSALLEHFRDALPEARWSWGMCDGLFTPRPLGPLFDVADQRGGALLELCRAGAGREELFRGLLREVSEPGTLNAVVVEDVHWADEATLDLLRYLGRRVWNAPVLLLVTYRDDGPVADDSLRVALGDLASQRSTRRIGLAPLSAAAVRVLSDGTGWAAAELHRLTGGNPFYVTEVVRAGTGELPASARDAVLARAARLGGEARRALEVAALTGARAEVRLLETVSGCGPAAMDELLRCGLVAEDGQWLRFCHEIARLAVAGAVPGHRGRAVHGLVLEALGELGCDDHARMAFHAEAAGDAAAVLRHAPAAARRAAWLASHREAAAQYRRALRFAAEPRPGPGGAGAGDMGAGVVDASALAGLYQGLADEAALLDRWEEAVDSCERALTCWREAGDRLREGDALRRLSRVLWNLCRGDDSVTAAEASVSVLEPLGPSVELTWAYATFANRRMLQGQHEAATALALRAQAIAEPLGAADVLSDVLNTMAVSGAAEEQEWERPMRRALEIALAGRHQDQAGRAFGNMAGLYVNQRRFAEAERCLAEGIAYCDEHDLPTYAGHLRSERATVLELTGRWDECVAACAGLLDEATPYTCSRVFVLRKLGLLRARRGESGVWSCFDEAVLSADLTGEPQQIVPVRLARAEAYWLEGRLDQARHEAELADDACGGCGPWERGESAVWLRRTGSARTGTRGAVAPPYRMRLDGDLARAAQTWTDLGCPYEAALVLTDSPAEADLRRSLELLTALNAVPAAQIVRQRLRTLGARSLPAGPRTTTRAHPYGLTRREQQILALLCARHTNAEIAAKLFISARTVAHHVSAVLAKLGAPSRTAAADQATRLGLIDAEVWAPEPRA
ncbi:ATP-binding protein [Nonomuraea rhizosphaerae]|uniref:ATP-binding protein n=1 Tax=Nonomuraea rhizosphaerae TaxID=2665663 RepID=UPI001C5F5928|nr:AAA family ATPase [Nonomuraea rhizosphaerae]